MLAIALYRQRWSLGWGESNMDDCQRMLSDGREVVAYL